MIVSGKGTKLFIKVTGVWEFVSQLREVTPPGVSSEVEDTTVHDTESAARTYAKTLTDFGNVSANFFFDPTITSHARLQTLSTDVETTPAEFRITFPERLGVGPLDFDGLVTGFDVMSEVGGLEKAALTIKVTGNVVDVAPSIVAVTVTDDLAGEYITDDVITLRAEFSEVVRVVTTSGTPRIAITLDSGTVDALYTGGTNTAFLTFAYTFLEADQAEATELDIVSPLQLNSGTIKDVAGSAAVLTFTPPDTAAFSVNPA
jgi:hypothetical protein